jgi:AmmeMemoRadiSam system protein A
MYSPEQRQLLLSIARKSIGAALRSSLPMFPPVDDPDLKELRGVFVSVHHLGDLRGCIGRVEPTHPLHEAVARLALAAAFQDRRFRPIRLNEFDEIDIEISVLSPMMRINGVEDIVIGRDGLAVRRGEQAGLLLPQVAPEQGWDAPTLLTHTFLKAGLPPTAVTDPASEIYRFEAEVFGEKPRPSHPAGR